MQVLLIVCRFEKCSFILMFLTNLVQFQLIVVACWPIEGGTRRGYKEEECEEKGKIMSMYLY
jgi:hypothetical protein